MHYRSLLKEYRGEFQNQLLFRPERNTQTLAIPLHLKNVTFESFRKLKNYLSSNCVLDPVLSVIPQPGAIEVECAWRLSEKLNRG